VLVYKGHGSNHAPAAGLKFKGHSGLTLFDEDKLTNVIKLMATPFSPINWAVVAYKNPLQLELKNQGITGPIGLEPFLTADAVVYALVVLGAGAQKKLFLVWWMGPNVKV
jgi:hypothetical protein